LKTLYVEGIETLIRQNRSRDVAETACE